MTSILRDYIVIEIVDIIQCVLYCYVFLFFVFLFFVFRVVQYDSLDMSKAVSVFLTDYFMLNVFSVMFSEFSVCVLPATSSYDSLLLNLRNFVQYASSSVMQPGGAHYMQQQHQAQQLSPQALMAARSSMLYTQQPFTALQQQALHGQLGMSSGGSSGLHMLQGDMAGTGGSGQLGVGGFPDFGRGSSGEGLHRGMAGGSKQDIGSSGSGDGRGGSSGGDGGETLYLKGADDGN